MWLRYVDDVFVILPNTINIDQLVQQINTLHPSIQFTLELEINNSLPFLDILVIKDLINHTFKFKVYRKPTHSNAYIHSFSHHNIQVKMGTITNIFLRAYSICSPEFLNDEIDFIYKVFNNLAYSNYYIHKAHMNARKTYFKTNNNSDNNNPSKYLVLPFSSDLKLIKTLLNKNNIQIANKNIRTLRSQFSFKLHHPIDKDTNVLYYVPCSSCPSGYIGESIDLNKRLYQHNYDKINFNTNNSIVNHIANNNNHNVNLKNTIVLRNINDTNKRKLIESVLINNTNNFNNQKCNYNLDFISNHLIYNNISIFKKLKDKIDNIHS